MSIKIGVLNRAANIQVNTLNEETRTVEVVFATETPCRMYNWRDGEVFNEVLGFDNGMIDGTRLDAGAPVLDNHDRYSGTEGVRGVVESWSADGSKGLAKIRFAKDEDSEKMYQKVKDGILRTLSVGYRVLEYTDITPKADQNKKGALRTLRATKWEPMEISFAPVPADPKSTVRKAEDESWEVPVINERNFNSNNQNNNTMTVEEIAAEKLRKENEESARKSAIAEGQRLERERMAAITDVVNKHRKSFAKPEDADEYLRKALETPETSIETVRNYILDLKVEEQPTGGGTNARTIADIRTGKHVGIAGRAAAQMEGLLYRMDPKANPIADNERNEFAGMSLMDMVRDICEVNNLRTDGSPLDLVQRAMEHGKQQRANAQQRNAGVGMSTSDLPSLFLNVMGKVLRRDYQFEMGKWKPLVYEQAAKDMRNSPSINLAEFGALDKVLEGEAFKKFAIADHKENFQVYKFGNVLGITLEMIINDDLGGIDRMIMGVARTQQFTEDKLTWNTLISNPTMSDSNAVFSSGHNNLGTGGAMTMTTLSELYNLVSKQTGLGGHTLDLEPKYLICGPANRLLANQFTSSNYTATKQTDIMPKYIQGLVPIVTAYIQDNSYYVSASPNAIDTIRTGGLVGFPGFSIDEEIKWENDTYNFYCRKFWGSAWTDFRGMAKNAGA